MKTNHKFGMYFQDAPVRTFVMDDFGNAVALDEDQFMQTVEFIVTGVCSGLH